MSIVVRPYHPNDFDAWDEFCAHSLQATLLHTRRFLSYHGERFDDRSLILETNGKWSGLLPAALSLDEPDKVVTHPGITYGGILHQGQLRGARMVVALEEICRYFVEQGCVKLIYKPVPSFYHRAPAQDDLYALSRLGARRIGCDLSSTIDLEHRLPVNKRRRRSRAKAAKAGVEVVEGRQRLPPFWEVLSENLERKHRLSPAHNLSEIQLLAERFPDDIHCVCGVLNDTVIAGTLLFITPTTYHAQYIASSPAGYEVSALDAIFEHCIEMARQNGRRWFDFGVSTERSGSILNEGLYEFKAGFGAGGTIHEVFELELGEHRHAN